MATTGGALAPTGRRHRVRRGHRHGARLRRRAHEHRDRLRQGSGRDGHRDAPGRALRRVEGSQGDQSNQHFAITLDNELISVPQIDWHQYPTGLSGDSGSRISGGFTIQSAQRLANLLKTGALPIKLELISASQVSATLGKDSLQQAKTAALITASVVTGGLFAGAGTEELARLRTFGQNIGLAFQIVDDVLDVTQTSEQLGKTAGKDMAAEKATYPALFGIDESLRKADALVDGACSSLDSFGERAETLKSLARFLVERKK